MLRQAEALAAHLRAYSFTIPNPDDDRAGSILEAGETSTTSAGDWFPTPHGLLLGLGLPPLRALPLSLPAQPHHRTFSGAGEALAEHLIYPLEGKEVVELGAGIANHSVLLHRMKPKRLALTELDDKRCDCFTFCSLTSLSFTSLFSLTFCSHFRRDSLFPLSFLSRFARWSRRLIATRRTMGANKCTEGVEYLVADWLRTPTPTHNPPAAHGASLRQRGQPVALESSPALDWSSLGLC